jgi:hypothetical protein
MLMLPAHEAGSAAGAGLAGALRGPRRGAVRSVFFCSEGMASH